MNISMDKSSALIAQAAAEWFVTLRADVVSHDQRSHFAAWLAESPVHVREYLAIADAFGALKAGESWPSTSTEELIAMVSDTPRVMAFPSRAGASAAQQSRTRRLTFWAAAASILVMTAAALLIFSVPFGPKAQEFSTARGEQRSIVLADGSVVQINTLSRVTVDFDAHERRIELPEGEAYFRVAHDDTRPLIVTTPSATVHAIGTEFNVYSRGQGTEVAVLEGRVGVAASGSVDRLAPTSTTGSAPAAASGPSAMIVLAARETLSIDAKGHVGERTTTREPKEIISWMQRRLVFDGDRVERVVEEFNRYNTRQLRVSDPGIAALRISGVFDADDPGALIKYLEQLQGVGTARHGLSLAPEARTRSSAE
ncbi:MAG: hypothetical protein CMLOHMNK_03019 [Steroidobacteraceae bacterium]|nr:hypothetical protein [Steroidobacteraceae bacterium]